VITIDNISVELDNNDMAKIAGGLLSSNAGLASAGALPVESIGFQYSGVEFGYSQQSASAPLSSRPTQRIVV